MPIKHGHCIGGQSPENLAWTLAKSRCHNPDHKSFKNYGLRGIAVCDRWRFGDDKKGGFECFLDDMGLRPSPHHSLERSDNSKGYFPENCKWSTRKEQQRNKRSNRMVTFFGEEMCVAQLAEWAGIANDVLLKRLAKGWKFGRALSESPRFRSPRFFVELMGKRMRLVDAAKLRGLTPATVSKRISHGWSVDRALAEPIRAYGRST
jgi:hypothetical protein